MGHVSLLCNILARIAFGQISSLCVFGWNEQQLLGMAHVKPLSSHKLSYLDIGCDLGYQLVLNKDICCHKMIVIHHSTTL